MQIDDAMAHFAYFPRMTAIKPASVSPLDCPVFIFLI
jgi:hypothetical protein